VRELPSGTVTFLFTDVEGSTRLLHELGDGYAEVLAEHRRVLRDAFACHGGVEVDTQGDAFFVAFAKASDALAAAVEGRDALATGRIRVRIGLHTGEPLVTDEGYVGLDVHRAARIAAAGHGGQIVVSESTRDLVADSLRELGEHRLKDLSAPQRLYQVGDGDFPPLRTLYQTNLPVQPTPLIGRQRELEDTSSLLREHRLLTLVGPGGSGKTRLALQLAADAGDEFPGGVFWVPLQALRDPSLVETTISQAVGSADGLIQHVGDKRLLLLLDNFEQVAEAAGTVADLLAATPNARVLVTSREPLRIAGEQRYSVEPLPESDAVELFLERARAVDRSIESSDAVALICRRLDGLPLALELAAARVSVLEPAELFARLEKRLPLLTSGSRDAPERQQTLRAAIEWSFDLLAREEQCLFARLAVFAGSFDLDGVEAVCDGDLDALQSLVDKSLVRRWGSGRYGMLETVHEFAREHFDAMTQAADTRRLHALYLLRVAEEAEPHLRGAEQARWLERVDWEVNDLREALAFATAELDHDVLLRLTASLSRYWSVRGYVSEGRAWCERALAAAHEEGLPSLRTRHGAAWLAFLQLDLGAVEHHALAGLAEAERVGAPAEAANFLRRLGDVAEERDEYDQALRWYGESIPISRELGDKSGLGASLANLGDLEFVQGNLDHAAELYGEALALYHEIGQPEGIVITVQNLGLAALMAGRIDDAVRYLNESLTRAHELGDARCLGDGVEAMAGVAAHRGDTVAAARLLGAADRLREESGNSLHRVEQAVHERTVALLCERMDPETLAATQVEGRELDGEEAMRKALAVD
jgi:predicted ATPase